MKDFFGRLNMNWFHRFITFYPSIVLLIISVLCAITTYVSLYEKKLPSFEDPQLGFETRGTEISQRIVAWDNLYEESRSSGSLLINPSTLIDKSSHGLSMTKQQPAQKEFPLRRVTRDEEGTVSGEKNDDEEETGKIHKRRKNKERWEQLKRAEFPKRDEQNPHNEQFKQIYRLSYNLNYFCDEVQPGYGQIVLTAKPNRNLFSYEAIVDLCNFQSAIEAIPNYMRVCITSDSGNCCNMWSLPNYIAWISKLQSCTHITEKEVNTTRMLLESCLPYYRDGKLSPMYTGKDVPRGCSQNRDVYNIMQYILDSDFLPSSKKNSNYLTDSSVYLPIAKSRSSLDFFHDLENSALSSDYFEIKAMDLGVKYSLFDEYLKHDIRYLLLSTVFIVICAWLYTGCGFVTFLTVTAIFFSLINAYFIYTFVFGLEFFPFMNILAVIVSLGIGSDDAYIICKVWDRTKKENARIPKLELVYLVVKHSAVAVFVTTLTTVAAFLSSYWSSVTAVRCFSIFAGLSALINFIFMITWILSGIIISSEWPHIPGLHWRFSRNADAIYENILNVKSTFDEYVIFCVEKYNGVFIVFFGCISAASMFAVLCWPRLQVPDSSEFQLFERKHPFEQYDLVYKDRFRFSHAYSEQNYEEKLPLRFVWGVSPADTGNYLDPHSRGKLHLDPTFDVASTESQEWLLKFCRRLRMQPFHRATIGPTLSNCFIETFVKWMSRKCIDPVDLTSNFPCCDNVTFPYPRRVFNMCVLQAMASLYSVNTFLTSEVAGPRFLKNSNRKTPKIKAVVVEFNSNMPYTTSFEAMNTFYQQVDTWTKAELSTAPAGMKNGWFVSYLAFYDLQRTLVQDTTVSILISMMVALLVLFGVTINVPLSLIAILTITCIIFVSVSVLIVLGWKLNILESIAISLAIGMSVDFSLHYAVNYKLSPDKTSRKSCVLHALSMMAGPSLMAAITTGASGLFMLPSVVLPYIQIGIFLMVVSSISWIYATFFQMPLLFRYGPQNNYGQLELPKIETLMNLFRKRLLSRNKSNSQEDKSAKPAFRRCKSNPMYSIHEMEILNNERKAAADEQPVRSGSFSIAGKNIKSVKRMSFSLEQLPSGGSSVTFIHDDEYEHHGHFNTYLGI